MPNVNISAASVCSQTAFYAPFTAAKPSPGFIRPMPSGVPSNQLQPPGDALVTYVAGLPELKPKLNGIDIVTCDRFSQDNNGQSTQAPIVKTTAAVLTTAAPAAPIRIAGSS